jgi:hypothetical protein
MVILLVSETRLRPALPLEVTWLGSRMAGGAERLADRAIRVEIHLPVVIGVHVRAHREERSALVEGQDLDIGSGFGDDAIA